MKAALHRNNSLSAETAEYQFPAVRLRGQRKMGNLLVVENDFFSDLLDESAEACPQNDSDFRSYLRMFSDVGNCLIDLFSKLHYTYDNVRSVLLRLPKMALPIRIIVAPSSIATSKSFV